MPDKLNLSGAKGLGSFEIDPPDKDGDFLLYVADRWGDEVSLYLPKQESEQLLEFLKEALKC